MRDLNALSLTLRAAEHTVLVQVEGRRVSQLAELSYDAAHSIAKTHASLEEQCVAIVSVPTGEIEAGAPLFLNTRYYWDGRVCHDITYGDDE